MHQIPLIDRFRLFTRLPSAFFNKIKIIDDFCYHRNLYNTEVIIDVGCASYPQVGLYFAKKNYRVILIDPTRKHKESLVNIENKYKNITYIPSAIGTNDCNVVFYESNSKISGSLLSTHSNTKLDRISYNVEVLSIQTLLKRINLNSVGFLKLDLEGAEYELIINSSKETWTNIKQIYIEFHHHCTDYTYAETINCVNKIHGFGYHFFKLHPDVFLFYIK